MKYPEEIYWDNFVPGISLTRQKSFLVERAYDMGKADAQNLDGYSNLTAAIKAGKPIDWEELDGRKVQCVKSGVGAVHGTLERRERVESDSPDGWWKGGMDYIYISALIRAWRGEDGWALWVEGDIPLRRKTADQLKVGTYFLGNCKLVAEGVMYVGRAEESVEKTIHFVPSMTVSQFGAEDWEVIEELGTFQKPEENKK